GNGAIVRVATGQDEESRRARQHVEAEPHGRRRREIDGVDLLASGEVSGCAAVLGLVRGTEREIPHDDGAAGQRRRGRASEEGREDGRRHELDGVGERRDRSVDVRGKTIAAVEVLDADRRRAGGALYLLELDADASVV